MDNMDNKEISSNELMEFLKGFKKVVETKFNQNDDNNRRLEEKIENNFDRINGDIKELKECNEKDNEKLSRRIAAIEEDVKRLKFAKLKSPNKVQNSESGMVALPVSQPPRRTEGMNQPKNPTKNNPTQQPTLQSSWAEEQQRELNKAANMGNISNRRNNPDSNWLEGQSPIVSRFRKEEELITVKKVKRKIPENWFGDDETSCDESSEDSNDEDGSDPTGWKDIRRKEANEKKRKDKKERQRRKKAETSQKASKILGIGPITQEDIEEYRTITKNYEGAKLEAVNNYLENFLKYDKAEIKDMEILETKAAKDDIIYIVVKELGTIKELYRRKAECMNDDIIFRAFIPPQYYARFIAIRNLCADRRDRDKSLKTQMRFAHKDIEVLIKHKGENEPFRAVNLKEFIGDNNVPEFNYNIRWKHQPDRPPRRRLYSNSDRDTRPETVRKDKNVEPVTGQKHHEDPAMQNRALIRQRSIGDESEINKRTKTTALIEIENDGSFETSQGVMNIADIQ